MTVVQPKELSIEDYLTRVLALVRPLRPCGLPLRDAFGCVLAADVRASCDLPPFHSSAMDGYAVNSADTTKATPDRPVRLRMTGEVGMGHPAEDPLPPGGAMAVPTGGMMPPGADAVAPVEDCAAEDGVVELSHPVEAGRHVRRPGEDLLRGEMLVPAGRRLEAADLGLLAAAGHAEVSVIPRPAVGLLSTGNELVGPGGRPGGGQIFESNSFLLDGLIRRAGGQPQYCGAVPDDPDALQAALCAAAGSSDLLVCSGGVSAGRNDPVRRAFPPGSGVEPVQIAVQPGRPQAAGTVCGKPFFGLPGNPMAALVAFELFVAPAVPR
ncbi:MAG TPA: gephyrin-like molybdotransferase Glp, partial [Actinomycetota bacterium]|nr:gephyrin-like molybdotransferase Glp [Actinomycetota bacterium]